VNGILGMCNWLYRWYDPEQDADSEQIKTVFTRMIFEGIRKR
jgi:hypothetical protein